MVDYIFLDPGFQYSQTEKYHLSIQASLDGFSFSVHSVDKGNCLALKQVSLSPSANGNAEERLKEKLLKEETLNAKFHSVSTLWITPKVTLLPSEYFSEKMANASLNLCHPLQKNEKTRWNEIPEGKCFQVYAIPKSLEKFLQVQFPGLKIFHHTYPIARQAIKEEQNNHSSLYVHVENQFIGIFIPEKDGKHYFNTFAFQNATDLVYFALNVFEQKGLNPSQSKLILSGQVQKEDKTFSLLAKYITNVELTAVKMEVLPRTKGNTKELHHFINLLNLFKCE